MKRNFDFQKYADENAYDLKIEDFSRLGEKLRCIDDRSSLSEDVGRDIAIPGSGLGIVMDAFGALTLLRREGKHSSLTPESVSEIVEKVLGILSFHTDEKCKESGGIACGGCGHANGALIDPAKYLLSEADAKFVVDKLLGEVDKKLGEKSLQIPVYSGRHEARGVAIVLGEDIGLPSVGKNREKVYVYHKTLHETILRLVSEEIFKKFSESGVNLSVEKIYSTLLESARIRLGVTLEKLAANLSKAKISRKTKIFAESL